MVEQKIFREAMSRLGAAVNVITTDGAAGRHGFTASAVCSVTDTPPTLLVCMNRSVRSYEEFRQNGVLCVNVLSGTHEMLSGSFADRSLDMDARFASAHWTTLKTGAPVLQDGHVSFDCRIANIVDVGTHAVMFCEVEDVYLGSDSSDGLIWFSRAYHRLPTGAR